MVWLRGCMVVTNRVCALFIWNRVCTVWVHEWSWDVHEWVHMAYGWLMACGEVRGTGQSVVQRGHGHVCGQIGVW